MSDDRARFEKLFREHYGAVLRYAVRRVGTDSAPEVVAETFLTAWRRFDQVADPVLPWLYGVARRVVANELRRRARAARLGDRIERQPAVGADDPGELVPQRLLVEAALAALSERDREVLRLAEWEQLGPSELAVALECSTTAAKVRVHRARKRFARAVGADQPVTFSPNGEPA